MSSERQSLVVLSGGLNLVTSSHSHFSLSLTASLLGTTIILLNPHVGFLPQHLISMSTPSHPSSLPSSPLPSPPPLTIQPDHFYGSEGVQLPPSPNSNGRTWFEPDDDPLASRGIPVLKPSMEEFEDFEGFVNKIECWGMRSGIVKVIPPKQWSVCPFDWCYIARTTV